MANPNARDATRNPEPMNPRDRLTSPTSAEQTGTGGLASTVKEKAGDIAEAAGQAVGQAREKVQEWGSEAAGMMSGAKETVQDWASAGAEWTGENAKEVGQEVTRMIRRYPIPALLVGFAAGFLLARATRS
jgi:hypothetical protein